MEMVGLNGEVAKLKKKRDVIVAKSKKFSLRVQCVPSLAEEDKQLRRNVSALKASASHKIIKGGKPLAMRSKPLATR